MDEPEYIMLNESSYLKVLEGPCRIKATVHLYSNGKSEVKALGRETLKYDSAIWSQHLQAL